MIANVNDLFSINTWGEITLLLAKEVGYFQAYSLGISKYPYVYR